MGNLGYALFLIPKLKIENLSKAEAVSFMKKIAGDAVFEDGLFEKIYRISDENPGLMQKDLIMIDLKIEEIGRAG